MSTSTRVAPVGSRRRHSPAGIVAAPTSSSSARRLRRFATRSISGCCEGPSRLQRHGERRHGVALEQGSRRPAIARDPIREQPEDGRHEPGHVPADDDGDVVGIGAASRPARPAATPASGPWWRALVPGDLDPGAPWRVAGSGRRAPARARGRSGPLPRRPARGRDGAAGGRRAPPRACRCRSGSTRRRQARSRRRSSVGLRLPRRRRAVVAAAPARRRASIFAPRTWPASVRWRSPRRSRSSRITSTYLRLVPVSSRNAAGVSGPRAAIVMARATRSRCVAAAHARSSSSRTILLAAFERADAIRRTGCVAGGGGERGRRRDGEHGLEPVHGLEHGRRESGGVRRVTGAVAVADEERRRRSHCPRRTWPPRPRALDRASPAVEPRARPRREGSAPGAPETQGRCRDGP